MKRTILPIIFLLLAGTNFAVAQTLNYDFSAVAPTGQVLYYSYINGSSTDSSVKVISPASNNYEPSWTGYTTPSGALTIPNKVSNNGHTYTVTTIEDFAFNACTNMTSVTIANSIKSIGFAAFTNCTSLTSVSIPNSVTAIEDGAFSNCTSLDSIIIPSSVTAIKSSTFGTCTSLKYVSIPNTVTYIGSSAFMNCTSLASVSIPNSVSSISGNAFDYCIKLTSVSIPNTVLTIESNAFSMVHMIYYYGKAKGAPWGALCMNGYIEDSLYYSDSSKIHLKSAHPSIVTANIPSSVTSIASYAFARCTSLDSVTIPSSVTSIGQQAFRACQNLKSISIPSSITNIAEGTFNSCSGLTSVSIPNSVITIGDYAFYNCTNLKNVTIPKSITSISYFSFANCTGLTSVSIPKSVTTIGIHAFSNCTSLTSISIPDSVTLIGSDAFANCTGLDSVSIPDSVKIIGGSAFKKVRMIYYYGKATGAPWGALCMNGHTQDSLFYTNSSKTCLTGAHPAITKAVIPSSVTSIGDYAFSNCTHLDSVNIPNSVTFIGQYAFEGCTEMQLLTMQALVPPTIHSTTFEDVDKAIAVSVPCDAVNAYRNDTLWNEFSNIQGKFDFLFSVFSEDTTRGSVNIIQHPKCENPQAHFQAVPRQDYRFTHWSDGNTDNPRCIDITKDTVITAFFESENGIADAASFSKNTLVYSTDRCIVIKGATEQQVRVFDVVGRMIATIGSANETCILRVQAAGIYFVQINHHTVQRVVVW